MVCTDKWSRSVSFYKTIKNFGASTSLKFILPTIIYFHLAVILTSCLIVPNEAKLHSIQVSESPCRHVQPIGADMNMLMSMAKSVMYPYYVPMASEHFYRSNFEALMGRPARNEQELGKLNLRIRGSPSHTWITTGEDQRFFQQCLPMFALFKSWCVSGLGSQSTNLAPSRRVVTTLVWSDKRSAALFSRCILGHENDWYVLSTEPKLDNDVMKQVLQQVVVLGFNVSHAAKMKYNDFLF